MVRSINCGKGLKSWYQSQNRKALEQEQATRAELEQKELQLFQEAVERLTSCDQGPEDLDSRPGQVMLPGPKTWTGIVNGETLKRNKDGFEVVLESGDRGTPDWETRFYTIKDAGDFVAGSIHRSEDISPNDFEVHTLTTRTELSIDLAAQKLELGETEQLGFHRALVLGRRNSYP